ncbi:50S ribosomal protein L5 [bacterium]|nr:50S ribosomal protein L5 [bacterium]
MASRLLKKYNEEVVPELIKKFNYKNKFQVPKLNKIVINMGVGAAINDPKFLDQAAEELGVITGQKPLMIKAKKSIAGFKLREGVAIGCKVTLRRDKMYEFFDRLVNVSIPRIKDFRGLNAKSFDGYGNYTFGLKDQSIFPELNMDKVQRSQGMDICIEIKSNSDEESKEMLALMGLPFRKK